MNTTNCQPLAGLVEQLPGLTLEHFTAGNDNITIVLTATAPAASCPLCGTPSTKIHSTYQRSPFDLPWAGARVQLQLTVRKFFCKASACRRRIFTERLLGFLAPSARRTNRLAHILTVIAFALGGQAGSRLSERLAVPTSATSLLRLLRRAPTKPVQTPRILGIDDFALLKGRSYGTILVDLEQHRPIELLPDRSAETVATWLRQHPGVAIITRDRSTEYTRGIKLGAPAAQQVADRFHIVANLREALERQLEHVRAKFVGLVLPHSRPRATTPSAGVSMALRQPTLRSAAERAKQHTRQENKRRIVEQVRALRAGGENIQNIAQQLQLGRMTVYRYLRSDSPLIAPQRKVEPSILDEYIPYLNERWRSGCENGRQLWREIKEQGYKGSCRMVSLWAAQQRTTPAKRGPNKYKTTEHQAQRAQLLAAQGQRALSAKTLSYFLLRKPAGLNDDEKQALAQIETTSAEAAAAYKLTQEFMAMIRKEGSEQLDEWTHKVNQSNLGELQNFASGLERDRAAVMNALSMSYSNGQVEGQVNRLKLKKREMFGRASFELLRKRVLDPT